MIAYDSNVLIYYLENNPAFADAAEDVIKRGHTQGTVLSVLVMQETLNGFALLGEKELGNAKQALEELKSTIFIDVTQPIIEQAVRLTTLFGRKVMDYDAIHLATALENDVSEFYTNDHELIKIGKIKGLKIVPLVKK